MKKRMARFSFSLTAVAMAVFLIVFFQNCGETKFSTKGVTRQSSTDSALENVFLQNQTVYVGDPVVFNLVMSDTGYSGLVFQWHKDGVLLAETNINTFYL